MALGEVRNVGASPATSVRVGVAAFSLSGALLAVSEVWSSFTVYGATCRTRYGDSEVGCILPGEVGWFEAVLSVDPAEVDRLEAVAGGTEAGLIPAEPLLRIEGEVEATAAQWGGTQLAGVVRNEGGVALVQVSAAALIRDAGGGLIDLALGQVEGEYIGGFSGGIRPGESAEFEVYSFVELSDWADYEVQLGWQEYRGGDHRYAVAGVAHAAGVGGAAWRTSVSLTNGSGAGAHVNLAFHPAAGVPVTAEAVIPDGQMLHWDDVVPSLFGLQSDAAGYLELVSDVPLSVVARSWNETDQGSVGQLLPTLTSGMCVGEGVLAPLRGGAGFRTNIGLVNLCEGEVSVSVRLLHANGSLALDVGELTLGAQSWRQLNDVAPPGFEVGFARVELSPCCAWAYASVIDSGTGDPTTLAVEPIGEPPHPPARPGKSDGGW